MPNENEEIELNIWEALEKEGAVFLPATGIFKNSFSGSVNSCSLSDVGLQARYCSSSPPNDRYDGWTTMSDGYFYLIIPSLAVKEHYRLLGDGGREPYGTVRLVQDYIAE